MKKVDLIKFRCTPEFKARVAREATYRGVSLSEFVEGAIENELRTAFLAGVAEASKAVAEGPDAVVNYLMGVVNGEQAKVAAVPITPGLEPVPPVKAGCPSAGKPCNCTGACQRPVGPTIIKGSPLTSPANNVLKSPPSGTVLSSPSSCPHGRPPAACWECA